MDFLNFIIDLLPEIGAALVAIGGPLYGLFKRAYNQTIKRIEVLEKQAKLEKQRADKAEKNNRELKERLDQQDKTIANLNIALESRGGELSKLQQHYATLVIKVDTLTKEKDQLAIEKQEAVLRAETAERERDLARAELRGAQRLHDTVLKAMTAVQAGEGKESPPPKPEQENNQDVSAAEAKPGGAKG